MHRRLMRIAAATGLVAAIAAPLTLTMSAAAGGLPLLGGGSGSGTTNTITNTVTTVTNTVTSAVNTVTGTVTGTATPTPAPAPSTTTAAPTAPSTPPPVPSLPTGSLPTPSLPSLPGLPGLPGPSTPPSNSSTDSTQAPAGTSSANALSVPLLDTCVSCTSNSAGPDAGSTDSNATALRILGHDVSAGHMSGDNQNGSGNLIALPANPLLALAVADWTAQTSASRGSDGTGGSSSASSRAGLVDLALMNPQGGPPVATLAILEAGSDASWGPNGSSGNGYTNGVNLNLGNGALVIILLHSESHSSSAGQTAGTYVASINGNQVLSNTQIPQKLVITVPGVITISLLITNSDNCSANAAVGQVTDLLGMSGEQLGAFEVNATGCAAPASNNGGGNNGGGNNGGGNNGGGNNGGGNNGGGNNGGGNNGGSSSASSSSGVEAASTGTGNVGTPSTGVGIGILGFLLVGGGLTAAVTSRVLRKRQSAN